MKLLFLIALVGIIVAFSLDASSVRRSEGEAAE